MQTGNHTRTGKVTNLRGIYIFCKFLSFLNRSIGFPYRTVQIIFSVKNCYNISAIKDIFHRIKGGGRLKCNIPVIVLSALILKLLDCALSANSLLHWLSRGKEAKTFLEVTRERTRPKTRVRNSHFGFSCESLVF